MAITIIQDSGKLCQEFVEQHLCHTIDRICEEEIDKAKENVERRIKDEISKVSVRLDRSDMKSLDKPNIIIELKGTTADEI